LYSQKRPFRLNGVGVRSGRLVAAGAGLGRAAIVDATATWICSLGSGVGFSEQAAIKTETAKSPERSEVFFMSKL
jgi:hypothetical protein